MVSKTLKPLVPLLMKVLGRVPEILTPDFVASELTL
jgi:hypothetical protein